VLINFFGFTVTLVVQ